MKSKYGWQQSDLMLQLNRVKKNGWLPFFQSASVKHSIPLGLLLAIASRETNIQNIKGDNGHGRGLMQIDDRYHKDFIADHKDGLDPESNIDYGAKLLRYNIDRSCKVLEAQAIALVLKPAIAGYNGSLEKILTAVKQGKDADQYTTKKNYAADVLTRMNVFDELITRG